jgi:RNA polymerase sigma-70 factor, ECF subfamily
MAEHNSSEFARSLQARIFPLRRYARVLTRNRTYADDLVESCLLRALATRHLWQEGTDLQVWLFTMMHNLHAGNVRRMLREHRGAGVAIAALAAMQPDPVARLELLDFDRAIAKLPEPQRQAILLLGVEGMRYAQAASILRVPVGTVRSRIARARERLRELMDGERDTSINLRKPHSYLRLAAPSTTISRPAIG